LRTFLEKSGLARIYGMRTPLPQTAETREHTSPR